MADVGTGLTDVLGAVIIWRDDDRDPVGLIYAIGKSVKIYAMCKNLRVKHLARWLIEQLQQNDHHINKNAFIESGRSRPRKN